MSKIKLPDGYELLKNNKGETLKIVIDQIGFDNFVNALCGKGFCLDNLVKDHYVFCHSCPLMVDTRCEFYKLDEEEFSFEFGRKWLLKLCHFYNIPILKENLLGIRKELQ